MRGLWTENNQTANLNRGCEKNDSLLNVADEHTDGWTFLIIK